MLAGEARFTSAPDDGNVRRVRSIRDIRMATGHSQRSFAVLLGLPFETYRPLDSNRRPATLALLQRAEIGVQGDPVTKEVFAFVADVLSR
jgi:hypothetical protein